MKQTIQMQLLPLQVWLHAILLAVAIPLAMSEIAQKSLKRSFDLQFLTNSLYVNMQVGLHVSLLTVDIPLAMKNSL